MDWFWKLNWNMFFVKARGLFSSEIATGLFIGFFLFGGIMRRVLNFLIALTCLRNPNIKFFTVDKDGAIKYERFPDQNSGQCSHQVNKQKRKNRNKPDK